MAGIRMPRRRGSPRTRPARLLGDKAYSVAAIRAGLRRRGITATIPERRDGMKEHASFLVTPGGMLGVLMSWMTPARRCTWRIRSG